MSKTLIMRLVKLLHLVCTVALFAGIWHVFYLSGSPVTHHPKGIALAHALYTVAVLWLMRVFHAYSLGYHDLTELGISQLVADAVADAVSYAVTCLIYMKLLNPLPFLLLLVLQAALDAGWLLWANKLYFRYFGNRKAAIVYGTEEDLAVVETLHFVENKFSFDEKIALPVAADALWARVKDMQMVVIAGAPRETRDGLIEKCVMHGIRVMTAPEVGDMLVQSATYMQCFYTPMITIAPKELPAEYRVLKRAVDILCSFAALCALSPLLVIVAAAIKLNDGGPVFYRQKRLTRGGREFSIIKFRSMKVNAEQDGVAVLASENDSRITRVGRFIRACRIDELPQLVNILAGDMSIVGPRPERPEIAAEYTKELSAFPLRLQVKAGLTGFAQVCGKYNSTPGQKLLMDLYYINRMSFLADIKIILRTIPILFKKESTEGVEDGKTIAGEK